MDGWVGVGPAGDLRPGAMRAAFLGEARLCVARLENGTLAAFDDWCTHEECPLSDSDLEGERVVCYCHNSAFDVRTGAVVRGPATEPLAVYEVRVESGELQVRFDR